MDLLGQHLCSGIRLSSRVLLNNLTTRSSSQVTDFPTVQFPKRRSFAWEETLIEKTVIKKDFRISTFVSTYLYPQSSSNKFAAIMYLKLSISLQASPILITPVLPLTEESKSRAAAVSTWVLKVPTQA